MLKSDLLRDLAQRGLLAQCTNLAGLDAVLASGQKVAVYAGFDATADSLHVGHLITMLALKAFSDAGHTVWPLCGTGTALVGDPSGRTAARPMLDAARLDQNVAGVTACLQQALPGVAVLRNDWLRAIDMVSFLREVGAALPLAHLLGLDAIASRREQGISVLEAFYPLLQAFDFLHLAKQAQQHGLGLVQIGGADQWGNICTGIELIGKVAPGCQAFGLTQPLLTKADGTKMGKTAQGAVWLRSSHLDDRAFWNFWRTIDDARLDGLLRLFGLAGVEGPTALQINASKTRLATHVTAWVRGPDAAQQAQRAQQALFEQVATDGLAEVPVGPDTDLAAVLVRAGLAVSKTRARQFINDGAVRLDGVCIQALPSIDRTRRLSLGRKHHVALIPDGGPLRH